MGAAACIGGTQTSFSIQSGCSSLLKLLIECCNPQKAHQAGCGQCTGCEKLGHIVSLHILTSAGTRVLQCDVLLNTVLTGTWTLLVVVQMHRHLDCLGLVLVA